MRDKWRGGVRPKKTRTNVRKELPEEIIQAYPGLNSEYLKNGKNPDQFFLKPCCREATEKERKIFAVLKNSKRFNR